MRYAITISGRVQGVFFRNHTKEKADELGISGYVMNTGDGNVYCEAEGPESQLQLFLDWCGIGSPMSEVRSVDVKRVEDKGEKGFEVRRN